MNEVKLPQVGQNLRQYKLVELLALKEDRAVFLAIDESALAPAQLLIIKCGPSTLRAELAIEKSILSSLKHDSICRIVDFFDCNGLSNLVIEYFECFALKDLIEHLAASQKLLSTSIILSFAEQLATTIAYLHGIQKFEGGEKAFVIHGDISSTNVLINLQGDVKVIDFGCALKWSTLSKVPPALNAATIRYASPGRIERKVAETVDDIFAFGVLLWELATSHRYWAGLGDDQILASLKSFAPRDPRLVNPEINAQLRDVIMICLSVDYFSGFSDADELLGRLKTLRSQTDVSTVPGEVAELIQQSMAFQVRRLSERHKHLVGAKIPLESLLRK